VLFYQPHLCRFSPGDGVDLPKIAARERGSTCSGEFSAARDRLSGLLADNAGAGGSRGLLLWEVSGLSNAAVLGEVKVELAVVPLGGQADGGEGQEGNHKNIEDAEEDEARGDGDLVAAVRQAEGNGVQEPEEVQPAGQGQVVPGNADAGGANTALGKGAQGEEKVGGGAEGVEAPLVVGGGVGGDEVRHDPGPGEEDIEDNGGPGDAAEEAERDDDSGEGDDPVDVLGEEYLAGEALVEAVGLVDHGPAKVGRLGEVGDGADQEGDGEEIMEDLLTGLGLEAEGREDDLLSRSTCKCSDETPWLLSCPADAAWEM
jgi:hypothetical protein